MRGYGEDSPVTSGSAVSGSKGKNQRSVKRSRAVAVRAKKSGSRTRRGRETSSLRHDPQEEDPKLRKTFKAVDREVESILANHPREIGFCHTFWDVKRGILKEKYGIDWKSPSEMNPDVCFD